MQKQSIPNLLTWFRIVAIAPVLWLMHSHHAQADMLAFGLFALCAITDFLDGYLARKWHANSDMGRMLDPIADKLMVALVLVMLVWQQRVEVVPVMLILFREIFISGLREFLGPKGVVIHVSNLAKYKTTLQLVAVGLVLLIPICPAVPYQLAHGALWLAAALTVWTGAQYFLVARKSL